MPLQPQRVYKNNQLKIKEYYMGEPRFKVTPSIINIYKAHPIEFKSNTSLAESWARMQVFNKTNGFMANYYIDKNCIWKIYPTCEKIIKVVICENSKQTQLAAAELIKILMNNFKISQNRVKIQFEDKDFTNFLLNQLQNIIIKEESVEILTKENDDILYNEIKIDPKITSNFYTKGQWGDYKIGTPISAIKLSSNVGKLYYRVFTDKSWTPWITSGESCGALNGAITGIQLQYESEEYILKYRCSLIGKGWLPWKEKTLNIPYGKNIDGIEFKLEVK